MPMLAWALTRPFGKAILRYCTEYVSMDPRWPEGRHSTPLVAISRYARVFLQAIHVAQCSLHEL